MDAYKEKLLLEYNLLQDEYEEFIISANSKRYEYQQKLNRLEKKLNIDIINYNTPKNIETGTSQAVQINKMGETLQTQLKIDNGPTQLAQQIDLLKKTTESRLIFKEALLRPQTDKKPNKFVNIGQVIKPKEIVQINKKEIIESTYTIEEWVENANKLRIAENDLDFPIQTQDYNTISKAKIGIGADPFLVKRLFDLGLVAQIKTNNRLEEIKQLPVCINQALGRFMNITKRTTCKMEFINSLPTWENTRFLKPYYLIKIRTMDNDLDMGLVNKKMNILDEEKIKIAQEDAIILYCNTICNIGGDDHIKPQFYDNIIITTGSKKELKD